MLQLTTLTTTHATIPAGFQTAPVMEAFACVEASQEMQVKRLQMRIETLEMSARQLQAEKDALQARLRRCDETIAGLQAMMKPNQPIDAEVVREIELTTAEFEGTYVCGFEVSHPDADDSRGLAVLELTDCWAIGAVNIGFTFDPLMAADFISQIEKQAKGG